MTPIEITNLTKDFGSTRAVHDTSWSLPVGHLLGFLGPNGAGKTTTIRILLGFLKPTAGSAAVFGMDVWKDSAAIRRRVGYLSGDVRLYRSFTGRRTVRFMARARGMTDLAEADRLADRFQLDLTGRVRSFSRGMRQKLALIIALMHGPDLLILDEPTASLDPLMQQVLYEELRAAVADGRTVLFSSHSLAEVDALCDRVVILRGGRVVACRPIKDLRRVAARRVHLRFAATTGPAGRNPWDAAPDGVTVESHREDTLDAHYVGPPQRLLAWLATLPLKEVVIQPPDLEALFLAYYRDDDRNADDHRDATEDPHTP